MKLEDIKMLVESFCKMKGYSVKVFKVYNYDNGMNYCIRIRYGKYSLKFYQSKYFSSEKYAWLHTLIMLAYDLFTTNFNGWQTFGSIGIEKFKEKVIASNEKRK